MKKVKKLLAIALSVTAVTAMMAGCGNSDSKKSGDSGSKVLIGSAIYKFDDTFMTGVRNAMQGEEMCIRDRWSTLYTFGNSGNSI